MLSDDPVVELDVRVLLGDFAGDAEPEAVGEFHDVRLVHAVTLRRPLRRA